MSLTALAFLAIYAGGLVLAFARHPLYGLLVAYMWSFYQNPSTTWWGGQVPDLRWSLVAAVATLIATFLWEQSKKESPFPAGRPGPAPPAAPAQTAARRPWHANAAARLLMIFIGWMWLQTAWAVNVGAHIEGCILYTKYLVLFYILHRLLTDERSIELFAWSHVAGCFIWGWIAFGTVIHGRMELILGPGVDDSNVVGGHMATGLAFAGFLFLGVPGWKRWLALGAIPFILNAIILTASRSALLATIAGGAAATVLAPRGHRVKLLACGALGLVLFFELAQSDVFWNRASTIGQTDVDEMDKSAASRVVILRSQWQMVQDYPLGAGHRGNEFLSPDYIPEEYLAENGRRSAHNTAMAVLVDQGYPGILMFAALVAWAVFRLLSLRWRDRSGLPRTLGVYRAAVGSALAALFTSGLFVNLLKAEVGLWLLALLAIVDNLARSHVSGHSRLQPAGATIGPDLRHAATAHAGSTPSSRQKVSQPAIGCGGPTRTGTKAAKTTTSRSETVRLDRPGVAHTLPTKR